MPDGTYKTAALPTNVNGHYGDDLKRHIIYLSHVLNVSQAKIKQWLQDLGIQISEGELHNILIGASKLVEQEYNDIRDAGLTTAREVRVDDTGERHKGKNGFCLVIQNDLFAYFASSPSKSRLQFLKVLRGNNTDYVFNDIALEYIDSYMPTDKLTSRLLSLKNIKYPNKEAWDKALVHSGIDGTIAGATMLLHIEEAGILGACIEHGVTRNMVLLSDGAQQYNLFVHALCWIHAERAVRKLIANDDAQAEEIKKVRSDIWDFYRLLQEYKQNPNEIDKATIDKKFDEIFSQTVSYDKLAEVLRNFRLNKTDLLRVLDYPFIDLHNNSSEQAIRTRVIKKNISGQTRSTEGQRARDIFTSLVKTCRKLGISAWHYLYDRISKANNISYLPDLIRQKAQIFAVAPP